MGFNLEGASPAIADVDDAGVFARSLNNQLAACGKALQVYARRFVRAMFAPHHAENTQFRQRWLAPQRALDPFIFVRGDTVIFNDLGSNGRCWRSRHKGVSLFSHVLRVNFFCLYVASWMISATPSILQPGPEQEHLIWCCTTLAPGESSRARLRGQRTCCPLWFLGGDYWSAP